MRELLIQQQDLICISNVTTTKTNLPESDAIHYGGGSGEGTARSRSFGNWDNEVEE